VRYVLFATPATITAEAVGPEGSVRCRQSSPRAPSCDEAPRRRDRTHATRAAIGGRGGLHSAGPSVRPATGGRYVWAMGVPRIAARFTLVAVLSACSAAGRSTSPATSQLLRDDVVTVGSFDFTESEVVAEVYSQGLEAAGYKVRRRFGLGPREFVGPALSTGLVELVPEYAGTAAEFYSLGRAQPTGDVAATHAELVAAVGGLHVIALAAAPAEDANTFVVTRATAERLHLTTLSDLRPVAGQLNFGGPPECPKRPLCLVGLTDTYGLSFATFVPLDAGGPLTHDALREGLVDIALSLTTDPSIGRDGLVELVDDRGLQTAENITPLVRSEVVDRLGPEVVAAIDAISARLTTSEVRDLNGAAEATGSDVADVVSAWLSKVAS
jgi:osmoprotectant transport system substrate-binding protein